MNFFSRIEARGQGHSDPKIVCDTPRPPRCIHTPNLGFLRENDVGGMLRNDFSRSEARSQGHSALKTVCDTLGFQAIFTH